MRIGTRGSTLARIQAEAVRLALTEALDVPLDMTIIRTQGDRVTDRPLWALRGQGFFTKEIEQALIDHRIDLAVHSFKDLPSTCAPGLAVAAVTVREDPADLLVVRPEAWASDHGVPVRSGGVVGTSAVRRQRLMASVRPDIVLKDLRGNVPTRLAKLQRGEYDAIFLASAAARRLRLEFGDLRAVRLDPRRFVPSPGQGALAIEMREGDPWFDRVGAVLDDADTRRATGIERAVSRRFGGGCSLPLGAFAARVPAGWRVSAFWGGGDSGRHAEVLGREENALVESLYQLLTSD